MTDQLLIPEEKKYKTLDNNPLYIGGYLNMARHNIFLLINHLTETFSYLNFTKINDDENIKDETHILTQIFNPERTEYENERLRIYNYILKRHHLPFIKIFNSEYSKEHEYSYIDYARLHNFIINSFQTLHNLRDSFSHYLSLDKNGNLVDRKLEIRCCQKNDINLLFNKAPEFSFLRNHETQKEEDYNHLLKNYKLFDKENPNQLTDQGLYFFINLFLERSHATKFLKRFKGFKNETTPPFRATIQAFTSYSLKVPDIRLGNENPKHSLLMEILTELNKCPKELFKHLTDKDKNEFAPTLDKEGKQNVVFNSINYETLTDEQLEEALKELTALKRHGDRFPYFALRFLDETNALKNIRFQITLGKLIVDRYDKEITNSVQDRRVIKVVNAFGRLSDFVDKENEVLSILKKGYDDNDKIRFEQYTPHYNLNNNKIAFFVFEEDVEKIKYPKLFEDKKENIELQNNPSGFVSIHDLPKLLTIECFIQGKGENMIIDFIRNTNLEIFDKSALDHIKSQVNLNPTIFTKRIVNINKLKNKKRNIEYLSNDTEAELLRKLRMSKEELLLLDKDAFTEKISNPKDIELFSQIKYNYLLNQRRNELEKHLPPSLTVNMLPSKVLDFIMNIQEQDKTKIIHQKIKAIKNEANQLLKSLEKEIDKPINEQKIKFGELATFLARDIINMVINEEIKQKITTPYYNRLQNKIAYFSINKDDIIALCGELQLFDKKIGHVFLQKNLIQNANGLIDFYLDYLRSKTEWIQQNFFIQGKQGGYIIKESSIIPLSFEKIKKKVINDDFVEWLKNKSQKPVDLPNCLFNVQLEQLLKSRLRKVDTKYNDKDKFSVLLGKLFNDDTQPFYGYKRKYNLGKNNSKEFFVNALSSKQIKADYGNFTTSNEKLIRFTQTKDRILKLMCNKLLEENNGIGLTNLFLLKDVHPFSEHNPLDKQENFKQKIYRKGKETFFTIIAKDTTKQLEEIEAYKHLTTSEERDNYNGQKWYQWTIKDFGRFKRFISDKRIPSLSHYFDSQEVSYDFLEYQLKEYDKYREKIFELTFLLEKAIALKDPAGIKAIELNNKGKKDYGEVTFDVYLKWLHEKEISHDEKLLLTCRNKFSHSQIPVVNNINKISKQQMDEFENNKHIKEYKKNASLSISEEIYQYYSKEVFKLIEEITNKKLSKLQSKSNKNNHFLK